MQDQDNYYVFYQACVMEGCYTALFCMRKCVSKIKEMYVCKVPTGVGGFAKNKGSVAMHFKIDDSTFAMVNCHLQHGEGQISKRNAQLKLILDECFKQNKAFPKALDHNFLFVFGDLNFRVQKPNKEVREALRNKQLDYL